MARCLPPRFAVFSKSMFVHLKTAARAYRIGLLRKPFSPRRCFLIFLFTSLVGMLWIAVAAARLLDHLFFPKFRSQEIKEPLFIVAPPRSGTTFALNLLALDTKRFTHLKLFQAVFPSICFYRFFEALACADRHIGRPFSRILKQAENRIFQGWDKQHPLKFDAPEEDSVLFIYAFLSDGIFLLFPYFAELWVAGFPDDLPADDSRRLMRFYRSCLQRHLYATGPEKTHLAKATQFAGWVNGLAREFPDARFINLTRDPIQSIPSLVSMYAAGWRVPNPDLAKDSKASQECAKLSAAYYHHLLEFEKSIEGNRYIRCSYKELIKAPGATIRSIYDHFDYEWTSAFDEALRAAQEEAAQFRSRHKYALEEFGLTQDWIVRELEPVYRVYSEDL